MDQSMSHEPPKDESVTWVVTHNVEQGRRQDFEEWLKGIAADMERFQGHQGTTFMRPGGVDSDEYVIVVRFATYLDLRRWEASPERADWLAKLPSMLSGKSGYETETGLETWFQLPGHQVVLPPPKYKMAVLILLGLYPLLLIVIPTLGWLLGDSTYLAAPVTLSLEFFTRTLTSVLVVVPLMIWFAMPRLTKLLRPWLYPTK